MVSFETVIVNNLLLFSADFFNQIIDITQTLDDSVRSTPGTGQFRTESDFDAGVM